MKLFTLLHTQTNEPVFGLERQPPDNANFLTAGLVSVGPKDWHELEVGESVVVTDRCHDAFRMLRVE